MFCFFSVGAKSIDIQDIISSCPTHHLGSLICSFTLITSLFLVLMNVINYLYFELGRPRERERDREKGRIVVKVGLVLKESRQSRGEGGGERARGWRRKEGLDFQRERERGRDSEKRRHTTHVSVG